MYQQCSKHLCCKLLRATHLSPLQILATNHFSFFVLLSTASKSLLSCISHLSRLEYHNIVSMTWSSGYIYFMSFSHYTTINIFISGHNHVQGEQSFLEEPQSVISAPGGSVTFTCLVQNKGGECRWQKDGKVYINI